MFGDRGAGCSVMDRPPEARSGTRVDQGQRMFRTVAVIVDHHCHQRLEIDGRPPAPSTLRAVDVAFQIALVNSAVLCAIDLSPIAPLLNFGRGAPL